MVGVAGVPTEDRGNQSNGGFLVPTLPRGNAYDSLDGAGMVGVVGVPTEDRGNQSNQSMVGFSFPRSCVGMHTVRWIEPAWWV